MELTYVCPQFSIIPCEGGKQNHLLAENDIYIYVVSCCKLLRVVFLSVRRKPLLPGKNTQHQLNLIVSHLGFPDSETISRTHSEDHGPMMSVPWIPLGQNS